jgi:hypothetical protein
VSAALRPERGLSGPWQCRAVGFFGLLVAVGLFYRLSCVLLFLSVTYLFLLDKSWYLNHMVDPGTRRSEDVIPENYLAQDQIDAMSTRPDMIRQFADHVADEYEAVGRPRPEIDVRR